MKLVFISNYMSHHQYFLSEELYKRTKGEYVFIATEPLSEERIKLGWPKIDAPYLVELSDSNAPELQEIVINADAVIIGSAPYHLVKKRIRQGKLTFTYGERPYKKKPSLLTLLVHWMRYTSQYHFPNVYRLCASAFSPVDYARTNTYIGKSFCWGYFPEVKVYADFESLYQNKQSHSILWCGRMIDWKHPEMAIEIARKLKDEGMSFKMDIIGTGYMAMDMARLIETYHLKENVTLHNSMTPNDVRAFMEQSSVYLFTSDRQEGWGAVLNEAMSSGCAVVANSAIGSVPFLIKDKENGFIYEDGNVEQAFFHVKKLLQDESARHEVSAKAYNTMVETWNPCEASVRLLELIKALLDNSYEEIYKDGPCSLAPMINDNWYNDKCC